MNTSESTAWGYAILCLCALGPFVSGVGITLLIQKRINTIGRPWAFIPGGKHLKRLWEAYIQ